MNWLITGGCGFIGCNLIKQLAGKEHAIRVVDDLSVGSRRDLAAVCTFRESPISELTARPGTAELVIGDIRDERLALKAASGMDVIVHLAANTGVQPSLQDPRLDCTTNVIGTLNYLEAARRQGVKRFVFASSGGTVIGDGTPPIHEEMVPHPKSPYGASKSAGEGYCSAYHGSFGIDTVALRFSNVYGPGSSHKNSVVAKFIRQALAGEILEIYGDGVQTRDFIFIGDLTRAIILAATTIGIGGEVFQIASGRETTVNEIAEMLLPILKREGITKVTVRHARALPGEIRRNYSDTGKAQKLLGWRAETDLDEGLNGTVTWFVSKARKVSSAETAFD